MKRPLLASIAGINDEPEVSDAFNCPLKVHAPADPWLISAGGSERYANAIDAAHNPVILSHRGLPACCPNSISTASDLAQLLCEQRLQGRGEGLNNLARHRAPGCWVRMGASSTYSR